MGQRGRRIVVGSTISPPRSSGRRRVPTCWLLSPGSHLPHHLLCLFVSLLLTAADAGIDQVDHQEGGGVRLIAPISSSSSSAASASGSALRLPSSYRHQPNKQFAEDFSHHFSAPVPGNHNNGTAAAAKQNNATGNFSDEGDSPFENNTFTSTTIPIGDTAFLKCTVKNLGNRTISWIRRRDMHIITVDRIVYTNDERFNILHADGTEDWTLQIKYVQKRDNGTYECQVSAGKGLSSFAVHVFVVVPEAFIVGSEEVHIQQGSTINLVCIVEKSPKPPEYIFWYHNSRMINFGSTRDLKIQTETGVRTQSRLIVNNAQVSDSGNYTCKTPNAESSPTLVYISQGDKMAAIQRRKSSDGSPGSSSVISSSASPSPHTQNSSLYSPHFLQPLLQIVLVCLFFTVRTTTHAGCVASILVLVALACVVLGTTLGLGLMSALLLFFFFGVGDDEEDRQEWGNRDMIFAASRAMILAPS